MLRSEIDVELQVAKNEYEVNKTKSSAYNYANLLFKTSDFWEALNIIEPFVTSENETAETLYLAGKLNQILGNFQTAENYLKNIGEGEYKEDALNALLLTYYHRNNYALIKSLPLPDGFEHISKDIAALFTENPYSIEWENEDKISNIPFLTTDPLPVVIFEINGVPIPLLFDTGADTLILDPEVAERLNVFVGKNHLEGTFAGGMTSEIKLGVVEKAKLGTITLSNIPITILPVKHISSFLNDKGIILAGIVGTGFLRQFTSTIDYSKGQIIFRERSESVIKNIRASLNGKNIVEIPFAIDETHYMFAQGSINGFSKLNFFVDSGLALENTGFTLPLETLNYIGIPEPERKISPDSIGGGDGIWESGFFNVDTIGLGMLVQEKLQGDCGAFPPQFVTGFGYFCDGIISHYFLRQYKTWTLDFNNMVYLFEV